MSIVPSVFSQAAPWIAGVVGGLSANIAANWLWRNHTKPELVFTEVSETDFEVDNNGDPEARRFKILVKNKGRTAAKNCKPELHLRGKHEESLYEIERTVCWAENNRPARITINPDETAAFEFFRIAVETEEEGVLKDEKKFFVRFPDSNMEWSTADVVEWLYEDDDFSNISGADFHDKISKNLFEDLTWEINEVTVTSENTSRIDGVVTLTSGIEDTQGLVGMGVNVISD